MIDRQMPSSKKRISKMGGLAEKLIYLNASRSFELLTKSIQAFEEFLSGEDSAKLKPVYYQARGYLEKGDAFYAKALKNSRKFAGSVETYASEKLAQWRRDLLEKDKVLARSSVFQELQIELTKDEILTKWMSREEIGYFLIKNFEEQKSKKRSLPNIKLRMVLTKLNELLLQAQQLEKAAKDTIKKYYQNG